MTLSQLVESCDKVVVELDENLTSGREHSYPWWFWSPGGEDPDVAVGCSGDAAPSPNRQRFRTVITVRHLGAQVWKMTRSRSQFASHASSTSRAATASIATTASSVSGCSSSHDPSLRSMNNTRHAHATRLLPSGNR